MRLRRISSPQTADGMCSNPSQPLQVCGGGSGEQVSRRLLIGCHLSDVSPWGHRLVRAVLAFGVHQLANKFGPVGCSMG